MIIHCRSLWVIRRKIELQHARIFVITLVDHNFYLPYLHHHNPLLITNSSNGLSMNGLKIYKPGTIHNILVEGQACNHILKSLISPFKAFKWIIAGTQRPFFIAVSLLDMCISEVLQNELQSFLEENSSFNFSCRFLNHNYFFKFQF